MKYLYSWLKEFYPEIPSLSTLEEVLIQLGHDIESIEPLSYSGVTIAEVTAIEKHPDADRLALVTIQTGEAAHTVVCGAPNVAVGQKVAYAAIGTTLPCGLALKKAKIRGIESDGMLCAPDELGLSDDHAGLLILPLEASIGDPLTAFVPEDAIISLDITSNRGDVLSHFGLARDIKALEKNEVLEPSFKTPRYTTDSSDVQIDVLHPDVLAVSFGLVTLTEELARTPLTMQSRLHLLGHKSINLPTDITNYLLLAYGQPLHAYDADTLAETPVMGVRRAHQNESFQGLNGVTYTLTPQHLVIIHNDTPVSLAGVLGGEVTKVTAQTKRILFEAAAFHPKAIALSARGLGITTESSQRFERNVDPVLHTRVLQHAQYLLTTLSGATALPIVEKINLEPELARTSLNYESTKRLIGSSLQSGEIKQSILAIGGRIEEETSETLIIQAPTWRPDLKIEADYVEEIVRLYGLQRLPKQALPASVPQWKRSRYWRQEHLKDTLVNVGAYEIMSYPFVSQKEVTILNAPQPELHLVVTPMGDKIAMRTSLLPGLFEAISANPEVPLLILFEIAKIYKEEGETIHCGIAVASNNQNEVDDWWQNLFERLRLPVSSWMSRVKPVNDEVKGFYKIRKSYLSVLELPLEELLAQKTYDIPQVSIPDLDTITYTPLSKFQTSRRDIAFIIDTSYEAQIVSNAIKELDPLILDVELFDHYQDPAKLGEGKQSLAYHIVYQAPDRTLTSEEIQNLHNKVESFIKEHYHGIIR